MLRSVLVAAFVPGTAVGGGSSRLAKLLWDDWGAPATAGIFPGAAGGTAEGPGVLAAASAGRGSAPGDPLPGDASPSSTMGALRFASDPDTPKVRRGVYSSAFVLDPVYGVQLGLLGAFFRGFLTSRYPFFTSVQMPRVRVAWVSNSHSM